MPELPEVETVRRVMERALKGHTIQEVEVAPDEIVLGRFPNTAMEEHLKGAKVTGVGRKGKYWWIELDKKPWLFGHLGMAGWIREMGEPTIRIREMGNMPLDDEEGRPRFLKLMVTTEEGRRIAMTDGRRLSRLWLSDSPETDKRVGALGFDSWQGLPSSSELHALLKKRKAPLKAILLDQALFAGVGNWIADEVMLMARLSPHRLGTSLKEKEAGALKKAIEDVIDLAVEKGADKAQFPADWLFHVRWGGKKGVPQFDGHDIIREQVGGRTTAWVPDLQK
ncbi:MAG: hypothetical protein IT206_03220 [Fimbriimonadaceae bacterium]|nr:hypothetical protein [Fimbriimonadaceae bacterium]